MKGEIIMKRRTPIISAVIAASLILGNSYIYNPIKTGENVVQASVYSQVQPKGYKETISNEETPASSAAKAAASNGNSKSKSKSEKDTSNNTSDNNTTIDNGQAQLDLDTLDDGTVGVKYTHSSSLKVKVKIAKGNSNYIYDLFSESDYEYYPLQMGNGDYTVTVLKNISGNSYSVVNSFDVALKDGSDVFLSSMQLINWNKSTDAVDKAEEIAANLDSSEEKAEAIHDYLISYMSYSIDKARTIKTGYVPDLDEVYSERTGICYDFASTYAAMMRSVGVPTKLVMGTSSNVNGYHAWNEVYLNGSWVVVDNSYDSQAKAAGLNPSMIKDSGQYNSQKEY